MNGTYRTGWDRVLKALVLSLAFACGTSANQAPTAVASAGVDINTGQVLNQVTLYIGPADTGIPFTVNGAGSSDPDGDPLTYSWQCREANGNKCLLGFGVPANQVNYRPTFPAGTWDITLTVNDGNMHTATDTVRIKVLVDLTPPTVTPPQDTTVSSTETGGARGADSSELHHFLFNSATAQDNSTAIFTHLPPQVNGMDVDDNTVFPLGPTAVTFRIADNFGNVGMATAQIYVTDIQTDDIVVGAGRVVDPFGTSAGQVMLIRGGNVSLFCKGPDNQTDPRFFYQNVEVLVDSLGRAIFLAVMPSNNSNLPHYGLFRCDFPGDTPRMLGVYEGSGSRPAGDPVQFPGDKFGQVGGLHLARTRAIVIQNNTAQIVNEDSYVFAAKRANGTFPFAHISLKSVRYRSLGGFSEDGPEPEQSHNSGSGFVPEMFNYKGDTYSGGSSKKLRRQSDPLVIQASGSAFNTQFNASLHLFGGIREIDGTQGIPTLFDPLNIPNVPTGCGSPPPPGVSVATPASAGSYYSFSSGNEIIKSQDFGLLTTYNGLGLCGTSMTATCPWSNYLADVDEYLIDDEPMNDGNNRFLHDACIVMRSVPVRPVMPGTNLVNNLPNDASKLAVGPQGLLGTQFRTGRVFRVPDSPSGVQDLVSTPIPGAWGIAAFPPQNVSPSGLVIVIQINSPVDVLVTDASGRRLGVDSNGATFNDFTEKGHDTGSGSHPRFYVIRDAQPGNFSVSSRGTGSGPFEIHIFGVNLDRTLGEHLLSSGTASPGVTGKHDFTLDAAGAIAFLNTAPVAEAGFDQTATADASGSATVSLDGSGSFDLDGDTLSFTWGVPSGLVTGVTLSVTLPAGVHLLTLTVDDGKGGTGKDTVQITVLAAADSAPPVITVPGTMTIEAASSTGDAVNYTATAQDGVDGVVTPMCAPPSGSMFPLGQTTVSCTASDAAGNSAQAFFDIFVVDTTPPMLAAVANMTVPATGANGAAVNYANPAASDAVDPNSTVICLPTAGSLFALGTTRVNCTATDFSGNQAASFFDVTVQVGLPRIAGSVIGKGRDANGNYFVDVQLKNTGTGHARNARVTRVLLRTLNGAGTVTYNATLSPSLPIVLGNLDAGAATTARMYLNVPATVGRFSITETGTLQNVLGASMTFSTAQPVIP